MASLKGVAEAIKASRSVVKGKVDKIVEPIKKLDEKIMEAPAFKTPVLQTIEQRKYQKPIVPKKQEVQQAVETTDVAADVKTADDINSTAVTFDEPSPVSITDETVVPVDNVNEAMPIETAPIDDVIKQTQEPPVQQLEQPVQQPVQDVEQMMAQEPVITPQQLGEQIKSSEEYIANIRAEEASRLANATSDAERSIIKSQTKAKLISPQEVFNLSSSGDLAPALKAIGDLAGIETKRVSFTDAAKEFERQGFDKEFIDDLLGGKLGISYENSLQVNMAAEWSKSVLDDIGRKALANQATDTELYDAVKTISFNSLLMRSVKGYQTNTAQAFGALGYKPVMGEAFESILPGFKNKDDLLAFFKKRQDVMANSDLDEAARNKVLMKMNDAATTDSWMTRGVTAYLSGTISGFGTLARVVGGDLPRIGLRPANTLGASFWGAARNTDLFNGKLNLGSSNRRYATEALSQVAALDEGIKNGLQAAMFAWKNKYSALDNLSGQRTGLTGRPDFYDIDPDATPLSQMFFKSMNFLHSYGSRSVMTVSEFSKGIHYQMGLDALATRKGIEARDFASSFGKSEDEQWAAYQAAARDVYVNPPDDVLQEAKYWTLEARPKEGTMHKWLVDMTSNNDTSGIGHLIRLKFPFMATTTNDMIQTLEHTPLGAAWMAAKGTAATVMETPGKWHEVTKKIQDIGRKMNEDIKSGDYLKRDMALAKLTTGAGIMTYMTTLAADGKITGAGPRDKAEREIWLSQGALPFAFVIDAEGQTEGQTEEQRLSGAEAMYGKSFKYSLGSGNYKGKIFASYNGMSTFAALAGISATMYESSRYLEPNDYSGMFGAAVVGMSEYLMDYQMLTGLSDIIRGIDEINRSPEKGTVNAVNKTSKWLSQVAVDFYAPASGARKMFVKDLDYNKEEFPIDPDMPPGLAGLMAGWNQAMRGLYLSEGLNKVDIWGRDLTYDTSSVLQTTFGKNDKAEQIRLLSGASTRMPERNIQGSFDIDVGDEIRTVPYSVPLSDKEYKAIIKLASLPIADGGFGMRDAILELEYDNNFINGHPDDRKAHVESIMSSAFKSARDTVLENPEDKYYGNAKIERMVKESHATLKARADAKAQENRKLMMRRARD
jgi:hypothetical protein